MPLNNNELYNKKNNIPCEKKISSQTKGIYLFINIIKLLILVQAINLYFSLSQNKLALKEM